MNVQQVLEEYCENSTTISPEIVAFLSNASERQILYKMLLNQSLLNQSLAPFRKMLLLALNQEVTFRSAPFDPEVPDSHYEGIYRCAFLLYKIGNPADTKSLWSAKFTNMDVAHSLGVEYFLGAGLAGTRAYLEGLSDPDAIDILAYIDLSLSDENGKWSWREKWERAQIENIQQA